MNYLKLIHPETQESLVLCPELGGTVVSLTLGDKLHQVMGSDTDDELLMNPLFRGRFLFPFNDRIPGGRYSFQGTDYQLPINCTEDGSAIHGFLYNKEVMILEKNESDVTLFWRTGKEQFSGYPFDLSLKIKVSLHHGGASFTFTVKNEGDQPAPYALGWHSYFKTDPASILQGAYNGFFNIDESFLPRGEALSTVGSSFDFSRGRPFSDQSLDHTFLVPGDGISLLKTREYSVQIEQKNFAFTQLFLPPDAGSLALEPISSKPNSFNSEDVLILEGGKESIFHIRIDIINSF